MGTGEDEMPMARLTRADVDSLKGETARDKLCEDKAEALIFRDKARCSCYVLPQIEGPITTADLESGAEVARVR
jgi:hypothetical protein